MVLVFGPSHDLSYHPLSWFTTRYPYTFPEQGIIFKGLHCLIPVSNLCTFISYCRKTFLTFLYTYLYELLAIPTQLFSTVLISACNIVAHYCILRHIYIIQSIMNTLFIIISLLFFHPMPCNFCLIYISFSYINFVYIYIKNDF